MVTEDIVLQDYSVSRIRRHVWTLVVLGNQQPAPFHVGAAGETPRETPSQSNSDTKWLKF